MEYNKKAENILSHARTELNSASRSFEHDKNMFMIDVKYTTINVSSGDYSKLIPRCEYRFC
jgi:hypothetical protein